MNILVDIGNSRLKWALESNYRFSEQNALFHQQTDWTLQLSNAWQMLQTPQKLVISCVAQTEILQTVTDLARQLWPLTEIVIAKSQAKGFGVTNGYQSPEKLGVDRWLGLIAARHDYPNQAIWIVDCGTAITIDFLTQQGQHDGGLIAPGLTVMKKSLLQNTAALNFTEQSYEVGLAHFTEAAIFNGTLLAAAGLIEQALNIQTAQAVVLLTGGDAALISSRLSRPFIIETDLVLKGLALIAHHS